MRRPISLKSDTCTEHADVDAAGISVKADAQYPGRSADVPTMLRGGLRTPRGGRKRQQKSAEAIVSREIGRRAEREREAVSLNFR